MFQSVLNSVTLSIVIRIRSLLEEIMPNCIGGERARLRMSQGDLADLLGVNRGFICQIEKDPSAASIEMIKKMAAIFNCSPDYLLGKTDERLPREDENDE